MARPVLKINHSVVRDLLRGDAMKKTLLAEGNKVAAKAGPGFEATYYQGRNRGRVTVEPKTSEAIAAQTRNDVLRKALKS